MLLIVTLYIICGILAYGIVFADFQRSFPAIAEQNYHSDMTFALLVGVLGPIGLLGSYFMSGFAQHGLKFR